MRSHRVVKADDKPSRSKGKGKKDAADDKKVGLHVLRFHSLR